MNEGQGSVSPETFCPAVHAAEKVLNSVKPEELVRILEEVRRRLLLLIQGVWYLLLKQPGANCQGSKSAAGPLTGASELLMCLLAESHIWKVNPGGKLHLLPKHMLFERDSCLLSTV